MYKVLIADDEPPFIRQITALLLRTGRFEVAAIAYNGGQALEELEKHEVQLLIADVRMPVVNGIDLIKQAHMRYPGLMCIIISGFADFAYAQGAIKAGACDYIVKPIEPEQFAAAIAEILRILDAEAIKRRGELVEKLVSGKILDEAMAQSLFGACEFGAAAVLFGWFGGAPQFFTNDGDYIRKKAFLETAFEKIYGKCNFVLDPIGPNLWFSLLITPEKGLEKALAEQLAAWPDETTVAFAMPSARLNPIGAQLRGMLKTLQNSARICGLRCAVQENKRPGVDEAQLQLFLKVLQVCPHEVFLAQFDAIVAGWKRLCIRQIEAASAFRQVVLGMQRRFGFKFGYDIALEFENALNEVASFWELCALIRTLAAEGFSHGRRQMKNSIQLFSEAELYIDVNIASPVTLTGACDAIHVSQPLLSRAVREQTGKSFNEYVTARRMDRAKALIAEQPALMLRDIAGSLGYEDQHYFSRVFKAVFGCTPTEFRNGTALDS
jgi:two-component system, response regulator YesN